MSYSYRFFYTSLQHCFNDVAYQKSVMVCVTLLLPPPSLSTFGKVMEIVAVVQTAWHGKWNHKWFSSIVWITGKNQQELHETNCILCRAISTFSTSLLAKSVAFPLAHVATHANDKPFPRIIPGLSFLNQYPCHAFKRCPSTIKHPGKIPWRQSMLP